MTRRLAWLALYAAAMAYVEAAVVLYLRIIYYPQGFGFPLVPMPAAVALVEVAREAATILMILAVAVMASVDRLEAFLLFAWVFGFWDIFYYVWLRVTLRWPPSLLTPDILFLIPVPWVGPVLAPVIVSLGLIVGAFLLLRARGAGAAIDLRRTECLVAGTGGILVVLSFTLDARQVLVGGPAPPFRWILFGLGAALGAAALLGAMRRIGSIMKGGGRV